MKTLAILFFLVPIYANASNSDFVVIRTNDGRQIIVNKNLNPETINGLDEIPDFRTFVGGDSGGGRFGVGHGG